MKGITLFFLVVLMSGAGYAQTIVTPTPPVKLKGTGITTTYSSETYDTPEKGKVIIQFWLTWYEGPKYYWIIKQAHLVITPPPGDDTEYFFMSFYKANEACELIEWKPVKNSKGITLAASVNVDANPGFNIGSEFATGVDDVEIESDPGTYNTFFGSSGNSQVSTWLIDWDDFSAAAASKSTLDFYAKYRCPKTCNCAHLIGQNAKNTFMSVEWDISGADVEYDLHGGKAEDRSKIERPKVKKTASTWTPPTSETRIAAVGVVKDEKVKMTSRGGSIGGTVTLETEEGEELATVEPDEDGHFAIDFRDIAALSVASTLVLTQVSIAGIEEASTTIEYEPGTPSEWIGPPVIEEPEVPFVENNQLYDIEGSNLGERAEVVITDEQGETILQETVSSSMNLTQYYLDAPIGAAEVSVRNDYGSSEPIEMGIYEFDVRAGKLNLARNEKTDLIGTFVGLPEGTKIIFTNMSENVTVKPNGRGKKSGDEAIFVVNKSAGEVSMTLKATQAGAWSLNYRLEFPEAN